MAFQKVKTYGRFKNRVIKNDLWISPQVQRNRLFVSDSDSSESSTNIAVGNSEQDSAVSGNFDNESLSSENLSSNVPSLSAEKQGFRSPSNGFSDKRFPQQSSMEKDTNCSLLVEHSTPYLGQRDTALKPRRLPILSPLLVESPLVEDVVDLDSPDLFSNYTQGHDSLANRNELENHTAGDSDVLKDNLTNDNGDLYNSTNQNRGSSPTTANKTGQNVNSNCANACNKKDTFSKPNILHPIDSSTSTENCSQGEENCNTDWTNEMSEKDINIQTLTSSGEARQSLGLEIRLQKLSSDDIKNISENIKNLPLKSGSTAENTKKNTSSVRLITDNTNNLSGSQLSSVPNMSNPIECCRKTIDHILEEYPASNSTSEAVLDECEQDDRKHANVHDALKTSSPVHSAKRLKSFDAISKKLGSLQLIDAKVFLDKREGFNSKNLKTGFTICGNTRSEDESISSAAHVSSGNTYQPSHSDDLNSLTSSHVNPPSCDKPTQIPSVNGVAPLAFNKGKSRALSGRQHAQKHSEGSFAHFSSSETGLPQRSHNKHPENHGISCNDNLPLHSNNKDLPANSVNGISPSSDIRSPLSSDGSNSSAHSESDFPHSPSCDSDSPKKPPGEPLPCGNEDLLVDYEETHSHTSPQKTDPAEHSQNELPDYSSTKELLPSTFDKTDPPTHSGNNLVPVCRTTTHPPSSFNKPCTHHLPETSSNNAVDKRETPVNCDILTPMTGQHTGQILKNAQYSSFVEALTPAAFQQGRRRPPSPKEKILIQCEQERALKFIEALSKSVLDNCVKVGEGTYGEVYKTNDGVEDVALKVIPVEGDFTVNDEPQKSFEEMNPEIVISKELSNLGNCDDVKNTVHSSQNFIKVKRVMLVQDCYPAKLLQEWDNWKNNHDCENERPDMFKSDQYFVIFEFIDGGVDMERFQFHTMEQALSVLQQVALSLSVGEKSLMFEHRDLHWGNVLVKRTKCKKISYKLDGEIVRVKSAGVFVSIIDFTLSRLTKDEVTVYCDLSKDPDIFKGKGDYQFQVYRQMRKANNNNWECHEPYSNVLWIRYLIDKVLSAKKYKKTNNDIQRNIRTYLRQVLSYESASKIVQDGFLGIRS